MITKPFDPLITMLPLVSTESTVLVCPSKVCVRKSKREVVTLSRVRVSVRETYGSIRPHLLKVTEFFKIKKIDYDRLYDIPCRLW